MIKKYFALLLCLIIILSMVSCEWSEDQDPPSQKDHVSNTAEQATNAKRAMELYEAAIRDEICVLDERSGEIQLKDLRFSSNDTSLDTCKLLRKAILDVDRDGVNEYVIQSPDQEYILLRAKNDKVYSYRLDTREFYHFNTDGSFHWYETSETGGWACGLNRIVFDGDALTERSIYRLQYSKDPTSYEYFVEGRSVTENEYDSYRAQSIRYERMKFSQFELTSTYPITAEQAWNLANEYWGHQDGRSECGAGTVWTANIALIDTPNSDTEEYRFAFQVEWSSGGGQEGQECMPPYDVQRKDLDQRDYGRDPSVHLRSQRQGCFRRGSDRNRQTTF